MIAVEARKRTKFGPRGAAYDLWWCREPEVLIEGPAGTGKTRAVLEYVNWLCEEVPGIRVLLCRQTRASMTESVLVEWEDSVLPPDSPMIIGPGRANRHSYTYPNGSHVVLGGLDNTDRIMSTQYDVIALFEATEAKEEDWEKLQTRLRNGKMRLPNGRPFHQGICDCNPSHFAHWLNRRADRDDKTRPGHKVMKRLLSRHEDNPSVTPEYLRILDNLTGARYDRLRRGLWVAQEGLVYAEWDPAVHVIPEWKTRNPDGSSRIKWYLGAMDFGYRNPGCLQVWGIDADRNMYRVLETYQTRRKFDWWAERVEKAHERFNLTNIVCDSANPEAIDNLNDRLGAPREREAGAKAVKADKSWMVGRDMVGELLKPSLGGEPAMYFIDDALSEGGGRDASRAAARKTVCTEDEFLGYTWKQHKDGQPIKEEPEDENDDHGLDCARYAAMFVWHNDLEPEDNTPVLPVGSIGWELGWEEDLRGVDFA